ncbi:MAG TPA: FadR/GntR family transcriptional regulator [Longilinea sp.]|nr:FadR/GntR family transcriptional regulator [Longilinea sp.]
MDSKDLDVNFGTFQKDVLSEKIVDKLLTLIREKQLRPGDRLPPERELALMMGVSRPSLREALRALSIMRVIENRQGSGTFVTSLKPELFVEHLDFIFKVNDSTFMDLFQARKILEVGLASLAAPRITPEEIAALEDCVQHSAETIDDPEAFLKADLELHQRIINAAQNHILALFMESINQLNIASRRRTGESPEVRRQTLQDHRTILKALKAHDPKLAGDAMRRHLDFVEQQLKEMAEFESKTAHG